MPDNRGKALLTDIGTEELGHIEMISTMIYQLTKDASIEELESVGLGPNYAEHKNVLLPYSCVYTKCFCYVGGIWLVFDLCPWRLSFFSVC